MELVDYDTLTGKLRDKRRRLGTTQQEVAARAGVSKAHLSRVENGNTKATYQFVYDVWTALGELEEPEETAADLCHESIAWVTTEDTRRDATVLMHRHGYSQVPVREPDEERAVGSVTLHGLVNETNDTPVSNLVEPRFPEVGPATGRSAVKRLLANESAVLVRCDDGDGYRGIVTLADVV